MTDKVYRIGIDNSKVTESNDQLKKSFEETQRRLTQISKENIRISKQELSDLKEKIKLAEDYNRKQEEILRNELRRRDLKTQTIRNESRQELAYREQKANEFVADTPEKRRNLAEYKQQTQAIRGKYNEQILGRDEVQLRNRGKYEDFKEDNKKQIKGLRDIVDTIKTESDKGIKGSEQNINRIVGGGANVIRGNGGLGGTIGAVGGMIGGAGLAAMVLSMLANETGKYEDSLKKFSVGTQLPMAISNMLAMSFRDPRLGMDSATAMTKYAAMSGSAGRMIGAGGEFTGLVGAQMARGFSDQQMSQLLNLSRYTSNSPLGTIGALESYVGGRDKGSLIKLPEMLDHYLRLSTEILNRTGRVDAISLQQSMMSIGKSYGVQGIQAERMTSGIIGMAGSNQNGIMRAIQMETLRSMYPSMSTWQMQGIMENPAQDPKYLAALTNKLSKFGGGGDWTKFFMLNQSSLSTSEVDKVVGGKFNVSGRPTDSGGKEAEDKYYNEAQNFVGSVEKLSTAIGFLKDMVMKNTTDITTLIAELFMPHGQYEGMMTRSTKEGTKQALKESGR